jgi:predicted acylesterase/phospholipase RssA
MVNDGDKEPATMTTIARPKLSDVATHDSVSLRSQLRLPGQVVLVMQGGGAPGCYQAGAYQALHEADIEPDWVIGTSIEQSMARLLREILLRTG